MEKFLGVSRLLVPVTGTSLRRVSPVILGFTGTSLCWAHLPMVGGRLWLVRLSQARDCGKVKTWPSSSPGTMCTAFFIAPGLVIQCQNVLAPENLGAKQIGSSQQEKGPSFSLSWNRLPVFVSLGLHLAYGRGCGSAWCFENWKLNGISSHWWSGTHGLESGNRNPGQVIHALPASPE